MNPVEIPKSRVRRGDDGVTRSWWCNGDSLYESYHDCEWGRPIADDRGLFEKLCLEGFSVRSQLAHDTSQERELPQSVQVVRSRIRRPIQRSLVERLLQHAGIVRHRSKVESTINNARRCIALIEEFGSLAGYVWSYEPDEGSRPRESIGRRSRSSRRAGKRPS